MKKNTFALFVAPGINWRITITPRSLRLRLALWALLLLGVTQFVVSAILFVSISAWLEKQVDNNLLLTATQVSSVLYDPDQPQNTLDTEDISFQFTAESIATQSFLRDQLFFVRLIDRSTGTILAASVDYDIPISSQSLSAEARFDTVGFDDENKILDVRIYTLPLSYTPQLVLQIGVSLEDTHEIQGEVLRLLALLLAVTAILAPLSGWFLANRALVPIHATARTAAEINETDLTQRLDLAASEIELEQLIQTFNAMLDRIEQAFRQQRQFTIDAAHELRTPLSIMQTGLDVTLSQERSAAQYRAVLVSVQEEVQRLSHLASALLMLARADTHELPLVMNTVDLSLLLNAVADQFGALVDDKNISIARQISSDLVVQGDEDRLIQVVLNLMDNAVKYTPPDGKVRIIAKRKQNWVELSIEDTGPGIPTAEQGHIFDRFYRVDQARNRGQGGFGLGLAIAKQIIELHHGTIRVMSEPGHGAQFVVTLPLHEDLIAFQSAP